MCICVIFCDLFVLFMPNNICFMDKLEAEHKQSFYDYPRKDFVQRCFRA